MKPITGIEPVAYALRVRRSTISASDIILSDIGVYVKSKFLCEILRDNNFRKVLTIECI